MTRRPNIIWPLLDAKRFKRIAEEADPIIRLDHLLEALNQ